MKRIISIFCCLLLSNAINAEEILPPPQKISEHVYAWIGPYHGPSVENKGFRMNMGFAIGDKAIMVFETGYYPAMAESMIRHIQKISELPIHYAVNLNSQPDRYFGNSIFKEAGAKTITTPAEQDRMKRLGNDHATAIERIMQFPSGSIKQQTPVDFLLKQAREYDLGNLKVTLKPVGATHTPDAIIAIIEKDKVIYAGDTLYSGRLPAVLPDGNVKNWLSAFDSLRQYKGYTFVPGHGDADDLSTFEKPTYQYLKHLYNYMTEAVDESIDIQEAIDSIDQTSYEGFADFDSLAGRNASWMYQEAERAAFE